VMLAKICRCCGQPGLVLLAQAGRFFFDARRETNENIPATCCDLACGEQRDSSVIALNQGRRGKIALGAVREKGEVIV